jgi:hypothetical protein
MIHTHRLISQLGNMTWRAALIAAAFAFLLGWVLQDLL